MNLYFFQVYAVQWLTMRFPTAGLIIAIVVLVSFVEWELRARYLFGRVRQRAHFDVLNLVQLPPPERLPSNVEIEPPTPFIRDEETRTDPRTLIKRAQDTISGNQSTEMTTRSAMEMALINLLLASSKSAQRTPPASNTSQQNEKPPNSPTLK